VNESELNKVCDNLLSYAKEKIGKPTDEASEIYAHKLLLALFNPNNKGVLFVQREGAAGLDYYANGLDASEVELLMRVSYSIINPR
jgi:hypothetical protein